MKDNRLSSQVYQPWEEYFTVPSTKALAASFARLMKGCHERISNLPYQPIGRMFSSTFHNRTSNLNLEIMASSPLHNRLR